MQYLAENAKEYGGFSLCNRRTLLCGIEQMDAMLFSQINATGSQESLARFNFYILLKCKYKVPSKQNRFMHSMEKRLARATGTKLKHAK